MSQGIFGIVDFDRDILNQGEIIHLMGKALGENGKENGKIINPITGKTIDASEK